MTTLQGDYEPSPSDWVRDQVAEYEASGGQKANTLLDTGMPIIVLTTKGNKSGKVRKMALMRVEHDGEYALVASKGGMPENPEWFHNLVAHPDEVVIQDGPEPFAVSVREVTGDEKAVWWERSVAAYPDYAEYQEEHRPADPGVRRHPEARLSPRSRFSGRRRRAKACTMPARHGDQQWLCRSSGLCLPSRTTTRSRAGHRVMDWPS